MCPAAAYSRVGPSKFIHVYIYNDITSVHTIVSVHPVAYVLCIYVSLNI